jgi:WhiB family redox-sensing transcriptional regulator
MNWREEAACLHQDPEIFFPVGTSRAAVRQTNRAKRLCAECPVSAACLRWAVEEGVDHGVWGGLTEDERRRIKRRTTRAHPRAERRLTPAEQLAHRWG